MQKIRFVSLLALIPLAVACGPQPEPVTPPTPTATPAGPATAAPATATPAGPATAGPAAAGPTTAGLALPPQLAGKAVVVAKGDPDEARADLAGAVKAPGEGGLVGPGLVVRLTADVPVWRMWSGAAKKDGSGRTNRMGQWWSYDAPHGNQQGYRTDYEICASWNDLTWVAKCTLKKGAVVAIGPGNSVSPKTCDDKAGKESYPVNTRDWQVWVSKVWARSVELECPADPTDYEADPADIAHPKKGAAAASK